MKYYKLKLTNNGAEVLEIVNRKGKDKKDIIFVTEDEMERMNMNTILVPISDRMLLE